MSNCWRETIALPGIRVLQCRSLCIYRPQGSHCYNRPILGSWRGGRPQGPALLNFLKLSIFSFVECLSPFTHLNPWWLSAVFVCVGVCTTQTSIQGCQLNTEDLCAHLHDCHVWLVVPLHKGTQFRVSGDWKPACALGAFYLIPAEGPCALVTALCNTQLDGTKACTCTWSICETCTADKL